MDVRTLTSPTDYDTAWADLNNALKTTEIAQGFAAAIAGLQANQHGTGFIKDPLTGVKRYTFRHPDDPSRFFRVQFNAMRMARFNGAGLSVPPEGIEIVHGGCYLCRENVAWQQEGRELGFEVIVNGMHYNAWMNPFPLMPCHVVMASAMHETQDWSFAPGGGQDVSRLIGDLTALASLLPGYLGFHNGVDAGASIAGHLHFQFFQRPADMPDFPLEINLAGKHPEGDAPVFTTDYPLPAVKWCGPAKSVTKAAAAWINDWARRNGERTYRLTANIIATTTDDGMVTLYFVPRDRSKSRGHGLSGQIGGLEVLGELVFASPHDRELIEKGKINYFAIEEILASVRTPLFID